MSNSNEKGNDGRIPYIGYGNDQLRGLPRVSKGDVIVCPRCERGHTLEAARDAKTGAENDLLLFYKCSDGNVYLAAVQGSLVTGTKPTFAGKL